MQIDDEQNVTTYVAIGAIFLIVIGSAVYFGTDWKAIDRANSWCEAHGYKGTINPYYCLQKNCTTNQANNTYCADEVLVKIP